MPTMVGTDVRGASDELPLVRTARCGHPATSRRGPVGYCDACRPIVDLRSRLRQAAKLARKRGDLPLLVKHLRAIASDPSAHELGLERLEATARAAREAAALAAAARAAAVEPAPPRPLPPLSRRSLADPDDVTSDWLTKRW